jgi:hypothetical protein
MSDYIHNVDPNDVNAFEHFLSTPRIRPAALALAPLAYPHEDIATIVFKAGEDIGVEFPGTNGLKVNKFGKGSYIISRTGAYLGKDGSQYIFSGYAFLDGKMVIGADEFNSFSNDPTVLKNQSGEFSICVVSATDVTFGSDYFGMVPWFYYNDDRVFACSNNYHLLLMLLKSNGVPLELNIKRSRVNMITSGFHYGTPFSAELDVSGCKINLAYEELSFSFEHGLNIKTTDLWSSLSSSYQWDELIYEDLVRRAKDEIYSNIKAAFEHPRFTKIVVDVSGGFDSRVVFAAATRLPKKLRNKLVTHTRKTTTVDDVEKASAVLNVYNYPSHIYDKTDDTPFAGGMHSVNLHHVSRTLGTYSEVSYVYTANYDNRDTLEITGYLGEVTLGFQRVCGKFDYSIGDRDLLSRLGDMLFGTDLEQLNQVFADKDALILETLGNYNADCLFKKFHQYYADFRNRFICGSSHCIENNNFRIPGLFSPSALKAKWLYFSKFSDNKIPDEKLSLDILIELNPILAALPFAKTNNSVIPSMQNLLNPARVNITPDFTDKGLGSRGARNSSYRSEMLSYIDNIDIAEQMLLHIYDYSKEYYSVCLCLHKALSSFRQQPSEHPCNKTRVAIRKIQDVYYQIQICTTESESTSNPPI